MEGCRARLVDSMRQLQLVVILLVCASLVNVSHAVDLQLGGDLRVNDQIVSGIVAGQHVSVSFAGTDEQRYLQEGHPDYATDLSALADAKNHATRLVWSGTLDFNNEDNKSQAAGIQSDDRPKRNIFMRDRNRRGIYHYRGSDIKGSHGKGSTGKGSYSKSLKGSKGKGGRGSRGDGWGFDFLDRPAAKRPQPKPTRPTPNMRPTPMTPRPTRPTVPTTSPMPTGLSTPEVPTAPTAPTASSPPTTFDTEAPSAVPTDGPTAAPA